MGSAVSKAVSKEAHIGRIAPQMEKKIYDLINSFDLLPSVLNQLIVSYWKTTQWEATPFKTLEQKNSPGGITGNQNHLFISFWNSTSVSMFSNNDESFIKEETSLRNPFGMDIDPKNSKLYVADYVGVKILNFQLGILSSWNYPNIRDVDGCYYGLKFDRDILYISFYFLHKIILYNPSGKLLDQWGKEASSTSGQFNYPLGITVDNKYVYNCDCYNGRVQLLTKEKGKFYDQWKDFSYPYSIFYSQAENIIYVGDIDTVQLRKPNDGTCIQKLEDQSSVFGLFATDDRLYVGCGSRIQIFKRATNDQKQIPSQKNC